MPVPRILRFGPFKLDIETGELRKSGRRIRLQGKPLQILLIFLENSAKLTTREELRRRLWPEDTFVDFDIGLNSGTKKLRDALGDCRESPRFIETLPRQGYWFIAPVEMPEAEVPVEGTGSAPQGKAFVARRSGRRRLVMTISMGILAFVFGITASIREDREERAQLHRLQIAAMSQE